MPAQKSKPSLRDRQRKSWDKRWATDPKAVAEAQRAYCATYYKRVKQGRIAGNIEAAGKATILFEGTALIQKLACGSCTQEFIVEKSKSNNSPKLCPLCQAVSLWIARQEYEVRTGRRGLATSHLSKKP